MDAILVPVKRLDEAKRRLAASLSKQDRRRLGLAMLADVLRATEKWSERWLVTSDPDAEAVGLAFGCRLVQDPGLGLNPAIESGTAAAISGGADTLLVLPSDVPLVSSDDLTAIFAFDASVVIASSVSGGTNGLLRRPPNVIPPWFGPVSAARHARAATRRQVSFGTLLAPSLQLDIDEPADLLHLAGSASDRESARIARELTGGQ